jgi:1,4-dihydroxy-2-naphthoate octaprenyltransferase
MSRFKVFLMAARPQTLSASVVPVLVGTAMAAAQGALRPLAAIASLVASMLIQIATNLVNDYADAERGADTEERLGPTRVTSSGLIDAKTVRRWALAANALTLIPGAYLVWLGGWPIAVSGVLSILSGWLYTTGPYPLGYHGLGDVFVLVFFGFVGTLGTYWVQAGALPPSLWIAAVPVACLATAILAVNNLRDAPTDVRAGKRTLAVRLGTSFAKAEYVLLVAATFVAPALLVSLGWARPWALLPLAAFPLAITPVRLVLTASGRPLNEALFATARLHLVVGLLLAAGLVV